MSIASKLTELDADITNAYDAIEDMGGTVPQNKNTNNLDTAILSISIIPEYTQLKYLESTGSEYINTLYKHKTTTKVEIKFYAPTYSSSDYSFDYVPLFGARNSNFRANCYDFFARYNRNTLFCYGRTNAETYEIGIYESWVIATTYQTLATYTNGTITRTITTTGTPDNGVNNFLLFNLNSASGDNISPDTLNSNVSNKGLKIAYCKIWDDDGITLVRDFIPVIRNSDKVLCFYDLVSKTYFENQGGGSFITGN